MSALEKLKAVFNEIGIGFVETSEPSYDGKSVYTYIYVATDAEAKENKLEDQIPRFHQQRHFFEFCDGKVASYQKVIMITFEGRPVTNSLLIKNGTKSIGYIYFNSGDLDGICLFESNARLTCPEMQQCIDKIKELNGAL